MRCLLVVPSWQTRETHKSFSATAGYSAPMGPLYLASVLREEGHEVGFIDGGLITKEELLTRIKEWKPELLLVSFSAFLWTHAGDLITNVKKDLPETYVVAGGAGPTGWREKCLEGCEAIDCVAYGEGEYTLKEIVSRVENGRSLKGVEGTIVREDGRIISNPPRKLIENLDEIPFPARDLVDLDRYIPPVVTFKKLPTTSIFTTRGCDQACIYCFKWGGHRIRYRSVQNVIDEIDECVNKYGIKDMRIWDDNFTADKGRVIQICDEIISRGYRIPWIVNSRVDTVDKDILTKMKKAGCWMVLYGVESGVQKNLDTLKKGIKLEQVQKAFKLTHEVGLRTYGTFMFGIPGETYDEGLQTINFACKLNPFYASFFTITPFPGTTLYRHLNKYGRMEGNTSDLTFYLAPFTPHTMTREEVLRLRELALKRFHTRPRYLLKRFLGMRSLDEVKTNLRGIRAFLDLYAKRNKNK